MYLIREAAKKIFLVVGPLREGRGVNPPTTKGKTTFFKDHQKSYDHLPGGGGVKVLVVRPLSKPLSGRTTKREGDERPRREKGFFKTF